MPLWFHWTAILIQYCFFLEPATVLWPSPKQNSRTEWWSEPTWTLSWVAMTSRLGDAGPSVDTFTLTSVCTQYHTTNLLHNLWYIFYTHFMKECYNDNSLSFPDDLETLEDIDYYGVPVRRPPPAPRAESSFDSLLEQMRMAVEAKRARSHRESPRI